LLVDRQAHSASAPVVMTAATLATAGNQSNPNTDASLAFSIFANQFTEAVAALESSVLEWRSQLTTTGAEVDGERDD
jgi:hypothetical protein